MLSCKSIHDINFMFRNIRRSQSVSELGVWPTKKTRALFRCEKLSSSFRLALVKSSKIQSCEIFSFQDRLFTEDNLKFKLTRHKCIKCKLWETSISEKEEIFGDCSRCPVNCWTTSPTRRPSTRWRLSWTAWMLSIRWTQRIQVRCQY